MAVVGIYPVVGHFPALHMVILSPISRDVKQLLQQSNNLLINCPGFNFWGHWALSDYNICSFFEVTGFASRRWAASSYQAVFMGRRPMPRHRGLFVKSPLWNPEKQRLTFIVWIFSICSQDIKDHRTCRLFAFGVAMRSFSASRDQPIKHGLRLQAAIRLYSWGAAPYPAKGDFL